jgi:MFS family permease
MELGRTAKGTKKSALVRFRTLIDDYPRQFWLLVFSTFIDRLGGSLLFPFFSLYITRKFGVGMTDVGIIFAIFSITGLCSGLIGGALTDRIGRKGILIFGLVMSATSALGMGLANNFALFVVIAAIVGLLADVGGPAQQAMVADLLPENKRTEGYGILRVVFNMTVVIGPVIGGLLASYSFMLLFIIDTITSLLTAGLVLVAFKETKKARPEGEPQESMSQTFKGYLEVLRDSAFVWFLGASMLSVLVYMQMNTTLAVYLRDVHGISVQMFGYILSLNATMVVLFQFPITRWISKYRPLVIMVAGVLCYAVGFSMYGYVSIYPLFMLAMVIITIGEMLVTPVSQSIVSTMAPEEMCGRYMAAFGFSWVLPSAVGPLLAGLVMDNLDPRWIWYAGGLVSLASAAAFAFLQIKAGKSRWAVVEERLDILEQLEQGKITAEEAGGLLNKVEEGSWAKLTNEAARQEPEKLRIQVSDREAGSQPKEIYIPMGLVNTIINTDCRISADLEEHFETHKLRGLIHRSASDGTSSSLENEAKKRVEVIKE